MIEYISILGSTGSIGTQTLEVAESLGIKIVGLAALKNVSLMEEQARRFKPEYVALHDEEKAKELKLRLADTSVKVDGLRRFVGGGFGKSHRVVAGIVGIDGLLPTVSAIEAGKDICSQQGNLGNRRRYDYTLGETKEYFHLPWTASILHISKYELKTERGKRII